MFMKWHQDLTFESSLAFSGSKCSRIGDTHDYRYGVNFGTAKYSELPPSTNQLRVVALAVVLGVHV